MVLRQTEINIFGSEVVSPHNGGIGYLYVMVLKCGAKIKKCKKKWFKQHYIIHVRMAMFSKGEYVFHLTPQDTWYEWILL